MLAIVTAVTCALVAERVLYACVCLLFFIFGLGPDHKSTWFVSLFVQNTMSLVSGIANSLARLLAVSIRAVVWCVVIIMIWWALYYARRHSAPALIMFQRVYNSDMGGALRLAIVVPAQLLQLIWDAVVPMWNLVFYCIKTIPVRVVLENILDPGGLAEVEECVKHLALFIQQVIVSLFDYVSIILAPPVKSFDADLRLLDLMTPLAEWRLAVSNVLAWTGRMCSVASSVVDVTMYPFLDINFGLCVHNMCNAFLYFFIHVPAITVDRCKAGNGILVYCLPDFEPVFELLVEGLRNMGNLVDNWMDITMIIIQSVLTGTSPACDVGMAVIDLSSQSSLMGFNETTIVGIATSAFSLTDGWNVQVFERSERQNYPNAFSMPVRVNYGIAKVSASMDVAGLLGCECFNRAYGMQIICAVAPLDHLESSYIVPVEFAVPTTSFFMACERAKIKVETIRKPVTRYTSNSHSSVQSPVAEAAIWVTPMCSSEAVDVVCIDTFKLAGCFPYCMALWTKGYTGSLVLRSADDWWNTVAMVSRDCGLHTWDLVDGDLKETTSKLLRPTGVTSPWSQVEVQLNNSQCVYSANVFSRMDKTYASPAYSEHRSIRLTGQPFAFAGDLVFTAVETNMGIWGIEVHRIWGNQVIAACRVITHLNPCNTSSERGPHFCNSSKQVLRVSSGCCLRCCSRSTVCCSMCNRACLRASDSTVSTTRGLWSTDASKKSDKTPATDFLMCRLTVRLGKINSSWIALEKLMSFLGFFIPLFAECRSVRSEDVSGLDAIRVRVCEALFLSLPVRTERRSSASMQLLSSMTRTKRPGIIESKDICLYAVIQSRARALLKYPHRFLQTDACNAGKRVHNYPGQ